MTGVSNIGGNLVGNIQHAGYSLSELATFNVWLNKELFLATLRYGKL
ncbi:hypothetical protein SH139x_000010 [Planctomycetaceae bacterium SH139]